MSTRTTSPFTTAATAAKAVAGTDPSGRRAVVPGGASGIGEGIGTETARRFDEQGRSAVRPWHPA